MYLYMQIEKGGKLVICKGELVDRNDDPHSFAKVMAQKSGLKVFVHDIEIGKIPHEEKKINGDPDPVYRPFPLVDIKECCITKQEHLS